MCVGTLIESLGRSGLLLFTKRSRQCKAAMGWIFNQDQDSARLPGRSSVATFTAESVAPAITFFQSTYLIEIAMTNSRQIVTAAVCVARGGRHNINILYILFLFYRWSHKH